MGDNVQPIIPPAPWYTSPTQVAALIAAVSQLASILIRWFGLPITDAQLDEYSADALQVVTILAGVWAMVKRQQSAIAPLTMTRKGAEAKAAANPPLLDTDPSKVKKTPENPTP